MTSSTQMLSGVCKSPRIQMANSSSIPGRASPSEERGASIAGVTLVSSTALRCTTGTHAVGTVDAVVTQGTQIGTLPDGFTYGVITPFRPPDPLDRQAGTGCVTGTTPRRQYATGIASGVANGPTLRRDNRSFIVRDRARDDPDADQAQQDRGGRAGTPSSRRESRLIAPWRPWRGGMVSHPQCTPFTERDRHERRALTDRVTAATYAEREARDA